MKRIAKAVLVLLGLIILSSTAQAEIFKWVDADGKVHFSDRKISSQAQKVNIKTGAKTLGQNDNGNDVNNNVVQGSQSVEQRLLEQKKYVNYLTSERLERQEKRQQAQQEKDKKQKLCNAMQDQLNGYTQGNYRWYELDEETGERIYTSDDQIEARKLELQSDIKSNCG